MFSAPATGLAEFSDSEGKRLSAKANAKRAHLETSSVNSIARSTDELTR
jgi:hypothetical protein